MPLVDDGIETIAGALGGSGNIPTHCGIGTGSTTITAGDTALNTETDRNSFTSIDTSVAKDVTYTADFSSTEISGTNLQEFGLFNSSGINTGSMFLREVIAADSFEGDRELQIQVTLRFAKSGT
jgi:hypothetical protein